MGSTLVSIRGGRALVSLCHCYPFSLSFILAVVHCCLLFVAVHCSLLSIFVIFCRVLLSHFLLLAWHLAMGDIDGGVVTSVGRVCVQLWPVVGVGGVRGCWLLFAGSLCPLRIFLPLLSGCGVMLGSCCRSWMPGTVRPGGSYRTFYGSDMVARQMWVVVVRCVEVVGGVVGMVVAH